MDWYEAGALLLGLVLVLLALGMPVFLAFLVANSVGVILFMGGLQGLGQLVSNGTISISNFLLVPVPLFILMGELFFHTGLGTRVFDAFDRLLGRLPGRLSYLAVASGTLFATLSGSSIASGAMMGSILVPEMMRRGYSSRLSFGPILGSGGLAMIIPPSALAVLLGSLAQINIGALLIAGLLPGLVLSLMYGAVIFVQVKLDPSAAPPYDVEDVSLRAKLIGVVTGILPMFFLLIHEAQQGCRDATYELSRFPVAVPYPSPHRATPAYVVVTSSDLDTSRNKASVSGLSWISRMFFVVAVVIGVIIFGIATPSESGAAGVLGVLILAACFRGLTWEAFSKSVYGTLRITCVVFIIIVGSGTFSQIMAFTGAASGVVDVVAELDMSATFILLSMFAILLVLGMFLDQISQMMLTLPVFMPLATLLGFDPIWFGVIVLVAMEMSLITPPFGMLLFVMMGVGPRGTTLSEVALAGLPYLGCGVALLLLLILLPDLALYMPRLIE